MFNTIKKTIFFGGLTALVLAAFIGGFYLGYDRSPEIGKITSLLNKQTPAQQMQLDFEPFWETWNIIEANYVGKNELERQKMLWGAISGLAGALDDPYSVFFPPEETKEFESTVRGDFGGVGMEIAVKNKILTVVAPLKNTPAANAGIKAGDKILQIDEKSTDGMSAEEAVTLIRGEKGTKVKLNIYREGQDQPIDFVLMRDTIEIPVLDTEQKEDGIFVIRMYNFSARSAEEFRYALREMVESKSTRLVLDLRNNPGGYLESAIDIASWFLPSGKIVAREQFADGKEDEYRSKGYNIFKDLPMVILINQGTASASEILAGALNEHGIAKLVGEKSYGKGSVQQLFEVKDGSSLKLTIAKWLTPNGISISKEGLKPDVEIKLTAEDKTDKQMEKALELVKNL